jgi:hypothetical protein
MVNLIGKKVKTFLTKQKKPPIIVQWKKNHKDITQEETKIIIKSDSPPNLNKIEERIQLQNKRDKKSDPRQGQQEVRTEDESLQQQAQDTTNNVFSVRDKPKQV